MFVVVDIKHVSIYETLLVYKILKMFYLVMEQGESRLYRYFGYTENLWSACCAQKCMLGI